MKSKKLTVTILSLSLLTVMAGAAVAPALNVIKEYFSDVNQIYIQLIVSMPALFIAITNMFFSKLSKRFGSKTLAIFGLVLYMAAGCAAGLFSNIYLVLVMRALVGVSVGIIMPLSTGLLSYYFPPEDQSRLMGYAAAMNQLGGVIGTFFAGILAAISWRASFLVYLMGLFSFVLCVLFLPNADLQQNNAPAEETIAKAPEAAATPSMATTFKENIPYIFGMFFLMVSFFVYPSNFAIEVASSGAVPTQYTTIIMVMMDFVAFLIGLVYFRIKAALKNYARFFAPACFAIGYLLLIVPGGWTGTLLGSVFVGFAVGGGVPFITSEVSEKAGKNAAVTIMPLISAALYAGQFCSPFITSAVSAIFGDISGLVYITAIASSIICIIFSAFMPKNQKVDAPCEIETSNQI